MESVAISACKVSLLCDAVLSCSRPVNDCGNHLTGIIESARRPGVGPVVGQRAVPRTNAPRRMIGLRTETATGESGQGAETAAVLVPEIESALGELCVRACVCEEAIWETQ